VSRHACHDGLSGPTSGLSEKTGARAVVLLLRSKSIEYTHRFWDAGLRPLFVKLLDFEFVNSDVLCHAMCKLGFHLHAETASAGQHRHYQGLILTSPRAAEAVAQVIMRSRVQIMENTARDSVATMEHNAHVLSSLPIFAVGNASSKPLEKLGAVNIQKGFSNAELLALHLCERVRSGRTIGTCDDECKVATNPDTTQGAPFLFLCGDKRRDCIPRILKEQGIQLEELVVYRSCMVDQVHIPYERGSSSDIECAAFFSPSGVNTVLSRPVSFRGMEMASSACGTHDAFDWNNVKKAAIGKTTASAIAHFSQDRREAAWAPVAIAEKPTASQLVTAVLSALRSCS
jgi:uroporphyrinogen-III synthase